MQALTAAATRVRDGALIREFFVGSVEIERFYLDEHPVSFDGDRVIAGDGGRYGGITVTRGGQFVSVECPAVKPADFASVYPCGAPAVSIALRNPPQPVAWPVF